MTSRGRNAVTTTNDERQMALELSCRLERRDAAAETRGTIAKPEMIKKEIQI